MFQYKKILLFLCFMLMQICFSQTVDLKKDSTSVQVLNEVIVKGILHKKLNNVTENITVLSEEKLQSNDGFQFQTLLNKVPGVFMQNGALNTNRVTIRGIGARSPFATTSIRTYFGDIPLTDGNGVSAIEDLELETVKAIEVHNGPAASSFGVGLGGTIVLQPNYGEFNALNASFQSVHGSFGLLRNIASVKYGTEKMSSNFVYSNTHSDGYRDNNEFDRETFTALVQWNISDKDILQFTCNFTDLKAFIPSSLNYDDYVNSPKKAAFTWNASKGNEDFQSYLTGLTWQHFFNKQTALKTSVFGSLKQNYESRPFNILDEESEILGARTQLTKKANKFNFGFGGEYFYDNNANKTFANLYEDFPFGTGSIAGQKLTDFDEVRRYYNLFSEVEFTPNNRFLFSLGVNLNKTTYSVGNMINNTLNKFNNKNVFSPKIGVLYKMNSSLNFRSSIAHGFANPTSEETLLPDGIFNPDLAAEKGWNIELGSDFNLLQNKLFGSLSVYNLFIKDLLVDRRTINDELYAINAGKTNHFGIEGSINYVLVNSKNVHINTYSNFSIYQYKFNEFIDDKSEYTGNNLTGVPSEVINIGASIKSDFGLYGNINFQHIGRIAANDANTVYSDNYQLTNIKLSIEIKEYKIFNLNMLTGVNNLFNKKYSSQLQVNAASFGGNAPRYYYPGNPASFYIGIEIKN